MALPAAVLVRSLTLELVGREDRKDALFRAEVLPLDSRVGLQIVGKHWEKREEDMLNIGEEQQRNMERRRRSRRQ